MIIMIHLLLQHRIPHLQSTHCSSRHTQPAYWHTAVLRVEETSSQVERKTLQNTLYLCVILVLSASSCPPPSDDWGQHQQPGPGLCVDTALYQHQTRRAAVSTFSWGSLAPRTGERCTLQHRAMVPGSPHATADRDPGTWY